MCLKKSDLVLSKMIFYFSHSLSQISVRGPFMVREHYSMVHDELIQLKASTSMSKMQYRRPSIFVVFLFAFMASSSNSILKKKPKNSYYFWSNILLVIALAIPIYLEPCILYNKSDLNGPLCGQAFHHTFLAKIWQTFDLIPMK